MKVMPECHKKSSIFCGRTSLKKGLCSGNPEFFLFMRSVQRQRNQYGVKQVDGVDVNGLASDFEENIRQ